VKNRTDLAQIFLKGLPGINNPRGKERAAEYLRLNTEWQKGQTDSRLGVLGGDKNGFPNGRRLSDDVVDIALQAVGGVLKGNAEQAKTLGDGVNKNDTEFGADFPYVALPHSGSITKDAPPADSGSALLTGGTTNTGGNGGFPTGQVSLLGFGALAMMAGAVVARNNRKSSTAATTA
jgi:hypothetical protein